MNRDTTQSDPPRLEVEFFIKDDGQEQLSWRMCGSGGFPLMDLTGFIVRVQTELVMGRQQSSLPCDERKLIITFNHTKRSFAWYLNTDIPTNALVGMLELIKAAILTAHMTQQQQRTRDWNPHGGGGLYGPDGQPWAG